MDSAFRARLTDTGLTEIYCIYCGASAPCDKPEPDHLKGCDYGERKSSAKH